MSSGAPSDDRPWYRRHARRLILVAIGASVVVACQVWPTVIPAVICEYAPKLLLGGFGAGSGASGGETAGVLCSR